MIYIAYYAHTQNTNRDVRESFPVYRLEAAHREFSDLSVSRVTIVTITLSFTSLILSPINEPYLVFLITNSGQTVQPCKLSFSCTALERETADAKGWIYLPYRPIADRSLSSLAWIERFQSWETQGWYHTITNRCSTCSVTSRTAGSCTHDLPRLLVSILLSLKSIRRRWRQTVASVKASAWTLQRASRQRLGWTW